MSNFLQCVIDANVGIKRFIADPLSPNVNQLLAHLNIPQTEIYIPDLFYIEIANIFWKYVRAGMYTPEQVQTDLATLKSFPLKVVPMAELMEEAVNIAVAYEISAYDASYVALAHRVSAPLLTLDKKLVNTLITAPYDVRLFTNFSIPPLP